MEQDNCDWCSDLTYLSIRWGKYTTDEGKTKFWRVALCASCVKEMKKGATCVSK